MALIDLTEFTIVDPGNDLDVSPTKVQFDDMDTGEAAMMSYDFGVDHIAGEWTLLLDFEVNNLSNSQDWIIIWSFGDDPSTPVEGIRLYVWKQFNNYWLINQKLGTGAASNVYEGLGSTQNSGHLYLKTVHQADDTYDFWIHTDAERTVEIHSGEFVADPLDYRYMTVCKPRGDGSDEDVQGYIQNIDIEGFVIPEAPEAGGGGSPTVDDSLTSSPGFTTMITGSADPLTGPAAFNAAMELQYPNGRRLNSIEFHPGADADICIFRDGYTALTDDADPRCFSSYEVNDLISIVRPKNFFGQRVQLVLDDDNSTLSEGAVAIINWAE